MTNYDIQTSSIDYNFQSSTNNIFRTSYYLDKNNNFYSDYYDYDSLRISQINDREYAQAYNAGIEQGKDQNIEKSFEMFKKLILPYPQGYGQEMIEEIFGTSNIFEIINNYKGKEIINMIEDYYNKF